MVAAVRETAIAIAMIRGRRPMRVLILLLLAAGLVGCEVRNVPEIELKDGRKYRCDAIWGSEQSVYCYFHKDGQSFEFEIKRVKWFTSHR
mgnify:CR=1 FL=1